MTDTQTLEKLLREALERIQKLENQISKQGASVSVASKASKWNGGYVTKTTYFEAVAQINDAWEELDAAGFLEKLYRTATNEPTEHPFEDRDAELRWWDMNTGYYLNAFPFLLTMGEESTPWLLIDQALAVRKDFYTLGMLTSGEGVLTMYGGVGWGPDGFDSNPFIWLGKGGDYGSKDYLEIRRTVEGAWAWGHLKCGDIYSNGVQIGVIKDKGSTTTDADGTKTVSFNQSFASAPLVFPQVRDASGRNITIIITSKSTTQFSVKVNVLPTDHKHKIGQASATSSNPFEISEESTHTHSLGSHKHKIGQAAETAEWTMSVAAGGAHYHGFGAEHGGAAVDLAHSHGSHAHTGSVSGTTSTPSATTTVVTAVNNAASGIGHYVGGYTTGIYSGSPGSEHTHGAGANLATDAHSVNTASVASSTHTHTFSDSFTTSNATISLGETITYVGGYTGDAVPSTHTHTLSNKAPWARGINLRDSDGNAVGIGATMMTDEDTATDLYTEESSGDTGAGSAHDHNLNYTGGATIYVRNVNLRDINGDAYGVGVTLENEAKDATDLYTEASDLSGESLEIDFDWIAVPA